MKYNVNKRKKEKQLIVYTNPQFDSHRISAVSSGRASGIKVLQRSNKV